MFLQWIIHLTDLLTHKCFLDADSDDKIKLPSNRWAEWPCVQNTSEKRHDTFLTYHTFSGDKQQRMNSLKTYHVYYYHSMGFCKHNVVSTYMYVTSMFIFMSTQYGVCCPLPSMTMLTVHLIFMHIMYILWEWSLNSESLNSVSKIARRSADNSSIVLNKQYRDESAIMIHCKYGWLSIKV